MAKADKDDKRASALPPARFRLLEQVAMLSGRRRDGDGPPPFLPPSERQRITDQKFFDLFLAELRAGRIHAWDGRNEPISRNVWKKLYFKVAIPSWGLSEPSVHGTVILRKPVKFASDDIRDWLDREWPRRARPTATRAALRTRKWRQKKAAASQSVTAASQSVTEASQSVTQSVTERHTLESDQSKLPTKQWVVKAHKTFTKPEGPKFEVKSKEYTGLKDRTAKSRFLAKEMESARARGECRKAVTDRQIERIMRELGLS
jgi:hypothetical protein